MNVQYVVTWGQQMILKKSTISNERRMAVCKTCEEEYQSTYRRSKNGLLINRYHGQLNRSKRRGHPMPPYSVDEFVEKYINNETFLNVYNKWVNSGYKKHLSPSFDRIDNSIGYTFENIRIVTWECNDKKAIVDKMNGRVNGGKKRKAVALLDNKGEIVKEFISASAASRYTGVQQSNISHCCNGLRNMAGGFYFKYI